MEGRNHRVQSWLLSLLQCGGDRAGEPLWGDVKSQWVSMVCSIPPISIYKQVIAKLVSQNAPLLERPLGISNSIFPLFHSWPADCKVYILRLWYFLSLHWPPSKKNPCHTWSLIILLPSTVQAWRVGETWGLFSSQSRGIPQILLICCLSPSALSATRGPLSQPVCYPLKVLHSSLAASSMASSYPPHCGPQQACCLCTWHMMLDK